MYIMGLRERVALLVIILALQVLFSHCMPKTNKCTPRNLRKLPENLYISPKRTKQLTKLQPFIKNDDSKFGYKSILKVANFPTKDYIDVTPHVKLNDDIHRPVYSSNPSTGLLLKKKIRKDQLLKKKFNNELKASDTDYPKSDFVYTPNYRDYRDLGKFPEVEYPMQAQDIWKPNFWNWPDFTPSNSQTNNIQEPKPTKTKKPSKIIPFKNKHLLKSSSNTKKKDPHSDNIVFDICVEKVKDFSPNINLNVQKCNVSNNNLIDKNKNTEPHNLADNIKQTEVAFSDLLNNFNNTNSCPVKSMQLDSTSLKYTKPANTSYTFYECPSNSVDSTIPSLNSSLTTGSPYHIENFTFVEKHPTLTCTYNDDKNLHFLINTKSHENNTYLKENYIDNDINRKDEKCVSTELDEEFTTDDPEFNDSFMSSTASPITFNSYDFWKQSKVLEPDKLKDYDELNDYFISV